MKISIVKTSPRDGRATLRARTPLGFRSSDFRFSRCRRRPSAWLCASLLAFGTAALAISPAQLQQKLAAREKLTVIDVRPTALFQQSHIPNAISIPASLAAQKQLPLLGQVVVYDGGLEADTAQAAAAALNQKPGISAQVLEGGFAAWETAQAATTEAGGLQRERVPSITYDRLKKMPGPDLVLVDLRQGAAGPMAQAKLKTASLPLTDLKAEFPNARVTHSPFDAAAGPKPNLAGAGQQPPLLVLIDSGDGAAERMARILKANGNKRFVVLIGGEAILARKGQPGLQRAASTFSVQKPAGAGLTNTNR
ncbi:MAG: rhodanese-like domain-containing protein [Verrucomicrobiota bacterium]|jgi:rhodanese-related sulfurtransferase